MLSLMNLFAVAMLGAAAVTTERPAESVFLFVDPGVVTEVEASIKKTTHMFTKLEGAATLQ